MKIVLNAYLDNNLGDDLMIRLFAEHFANDTIYLQVDNSTLKKPFEDISNIQFFETQSLYEYLAIADIHVTIGGSLFTLSNYKTWIFFLKRIKISHFLHRKKIKSALIGCNLGPFDKHNIGFQLAKLELKYKDLVTVRDSESYDLLYKNKNFRNKVEYYPDIVFSHKINKNEKLERKSLGISAYRSLDSKIDNQKTYKNLSIIADRYIEKYKRKVYIFAFDCERENDLVAAEYIKKYSKYKEYIEIIPYLGDMDEVKNKMRYCEAMIAVRFHSAILSGVLNIPFWAISYSNKMKNLMIDNDGGNYLSEITDIEDDLGIISNAVIEKKLFKFKNIDKLNEISSRHFEQVENLINSKR